MWQSADVIGRCAAKKTQAGYAFRWTSCIRHEKSECRRNQPWPIVKPSRNFLVVSAVNVPPTTELFVLPHCSMDSRLVTRNLQSKLMQVRMYDCQQRNCNKQSTDTSSYVTRRKAVQFVSASCQLMKKTELQKLGRNLWRDPVSTTTNQHWFTSR